MMYLLVFVEGSVLMLELVCKEKDDVEVTFCRLWLAETV